MRQTVLYIAMSLDGYIADRNGGVEWLTGQDGGADAGDSYTEFTKEIDTVVMGWNTYHQVTTELAPGEWVYEEFTSYIFTHREPDSTEKIRFVKESPGEFIRSLKRQDGKDIWICGGADIVQQLMEFPKVGRVLFTGLGEPLANPKIPDMIRRLAEAHVTDRIEIVTNASLLTHEMTDRLLEAGLTYLRISLQGLSAEKYKEIS